MRRIPQVATGRFLLIGLSFGAYTASYWQMLEPRVAGVVSLDGGIGGPGAEATLSQGPYFDPLRATGPLLHLYDARAAELSFVENIERGERFLVGFEKLDHADFTGAFLLAPPTGVGVEPARRAAGECVLQLTLAFADTVLAKRADRRSALTGGRASCPADAGARFRHLPAVPQPPVFEDLKALIRGSRGAGMKAFRLARRANPQPYPRLTLARMVRSAAGFPDWPVARELAEIFVEAYPDAADGRYYLGRAALETGAPDLAREQLQRALDLLPSDSGLTPAERERFRARASETLGRLTPATLTPSTRPRR